MTKHAPLPTLLAAVGLTGCYRTVHVNLHPRMPVPARPPTVETP